MFQSKAKFEQFATLAEAVHGDKPRKREPIKVDAKVMRVVESWLARGGTLPVSQIREAIGVGAWDSIMLNAMHKRLLKGWTQVMERLHWQKLVSFVKPVADFRSQYALQVGDFTTLDVVPEKGAYTDAEFTDDRASYSIQKYGKLFGMGYESMTNDDLGVLSGMVQRFGGASARTIEKYIIYTLIDQNPTAYDGYSLFDSTNRTQSNKLGSSKALAHDTLEAALELMASFTDLDGNYLDIAAKYLLVNPAQKYDARRLLNSNQKPGTGNNDINAHEGELELLVSSWVTSGQWYLVADPAQVDTIEAGFLGGRQEPEVFEENPQSGHAFAYDEKRYKGRVVFGAVPTDWRGFVGANFA